MADLPPLLFALDRTATEHRATVRGVRQRWENQDGSATVILALSDGEAARGTLEPGEEITSGDSVELLGRWVEHQRYGWQFKFDSWLPSAPSASDGSWASGLASYLAKHVDGVGPVTAAAMVGAYGNDTLQVLCDDPARVAEDGHLSHSEAREASEALRTLIKPELRNAHLALHNLLKGHGFWGRTLKSALSKWNTNAPEVVRRDPFRLVTAGLPGAGFVRSDRLYRTLGLPLDAPKRQTVAAWYALSRLDGHTWAPFAEVLGAIRRLVGLRANERHALAVLYRRKMCELRLGGKGQVWVGEREKTLAERRLALHARRLLAGAAKWPVDLVPADAVSDHQREALGSLTARLAILTGGPGTGKTHCAAALVRAIGTVDTLDTVAICAPTGKAAVRITAKMREAGLQLTAGTVHSLMAVRTLANGDLGFGTGESSLLPHRWVIVDEVSMGDTSLLAALLASCGADTHMLLVGDQHQLPPVGHGAPLRDLLAANVPAARLTEIRRNAGLIVEACAQIREGASPRLPGSLSAYPGANLVAITPAQPVEKGRNVLAPLLERIDQAYTWLAEQRFSLVTDVQVLCARNVTRHALNQHLQQKLNAAGLPGPGKYRVSDKVICLKNHLYPQVGRQEPVYVANGDMGRIEYFLGSQMVVSLQHPDRQVIVPVRTSAEPIADAGTDDESASRSEDRWDLAWGVTTHKYQGSECPVVLVILESAGRLSSREWLYTAISRAKTLCVLIGTQQDIARHVRNVTLPDCKTFLVEEILGEKS